MPQRKPARGKCFNCRLLDMRTIKDGRIVFWCDRKKRKVPDFFVWRRGCRGFEPIVPETG